MSRTKLKVGQVIMPEIQLGDGGDGGSTEVFVEYRRPNNSVILAEFQLPHLGDGIYREEITTMPDEDILVVHYFIRRSNGQPSNTYKPNYLTEVFLKDVTGQIVEDNLDKKISTITCPADATVSLSSDQLTAALAESVAIEANIKDNKLIGVIDEC